MECCICKLDIRPVGDWDRGNDARPVADGRCCDECNMDVVVPARLAEVLGRQRPQGIEVREDK